MLKMAPKNLTYRTAIYGSDHEEVFLSGRRGDLIDFDDGKSYVILDPSNIFKVVRKGKKRVRVGIINDPSMIEQVLEEYERAILENHIH
jgi:hypothetical protein